MHSLLRCKREEARKTEITSALLPHLQSLQLIPKFLNQNSSRKQSQWNQENYCLSNSWDKIEDFCSTTLLKMMGKLIRPSIIIPIFLVAAFTQFKYKIINIRKLSISSRFGNPTETETNESKLESSQDNRLTLISALQNKNNCSIEHTTWNARCLTGPKMTRTISNLLH